MKRTSEVGTQCTPVRIHVSALLLYKVRLGEDKINQLLVT
jgi:hypothetical protein